MRRFDGLLAINAVSKELAYFASLILPCGIMVKCQILVFVAPLLYF